MKRKRIIISVIFILACLAFIFGLSFVFIKVLGNKQPEMSFKNIMFFSIPGLAIVTAILLCGGYKVFLVGAENVKISLKKDILLKLVPKCNKKSLILSISFAVLIPIVLEGLFCAMEASNPSGIPHHFSIKNVLILFVFFTFIAYLILLYRSGKTSTKEKVSLTDDYLKIYDYIVFGVLAFLCFFFFEQADLLITVGLSFAVLSGHISSFYEYVLSVWGYSNYMITTYLVFALWNIPVRLLTGGEYYVPTINLSLPVIWWNKTLIVLCFFVSIILIFKICKKAGMSNEKARLGSYLYACSPISLFSIFIFGQYDIFSVICLLMAIYLLLDNRDIWSAMFIGLGLTFKITILLFYIPMLLIKHKNLLKVLGLLIISLIPYVLISFYYSRQEAFSTGVSGFGALEYIASAKLTIYAGTGLYIYLFPFTYILLCVFFYTKKYSQDRLFQELVFSGLLVSFAFFGCCLHHPQWFLTASPFIALTILNNKNMKYTGTFLGIMYTAYFIWVLAVFVSNVDSTLFKNGLLSKMVDGIYIMHTIDFLYLQNIFLNEDMMRSTMFTIFSAFFACSCYFGRPSQQIENKKDEDIAAKYKIGRAVSLVPLLLYIGLITSVILYSLNMAGRI